MRQTTRHRRAFRAPLAFAGLVLVLAGPPPAAGLQPTEANGEARSRQPANYCLGGIEDRKIIVDERRLTNPFEQTTLLGCEVDGGDPRVMPDLPSPSPVHEELV